MSNYPKISIITPTFNQGSYIEKTILSILDQNYPNLEYIIIDGGSTDETLSIIKKYEQRITYWISEADKGQSDAINKGIRMATGDIINWINSDDYLEDNVLFKIACEFENSDIDVVCGYSDLITNSGLISKRTSQLQGDFASFISRGHIMQPSTFFRKQIFDAYTPLATNLHYMMDHYLWLQYICENGLSKVLYVDYKISNVLLHEKAKSYNMIDFFKEDRGLIYLSLFKSLNLNLIYPNAKNPNRLNFSSKTFSNQIIKNHKLINFLLLVDILFKRDSMGKNKFNFIVILKLLLYFPGNFFNYLLKKFK